MKPINLRSFRLKAGKARRSMRRFLTRLESNPPPRINKTIEAIEKDVWLETDCLSCANCCKTMSPTFTRQDVKRISTHLSMSEDAFRTKYLRRERGGDRDWMNKVEPCQFLNLTDNKCSIYDVRPADCAGFPHLPKKFKDYVHVHKQNIEYCPATFRLVERMMAMVK